MYRIISLLIGLAVAVILFLTLLMDADAVIMKRKDIDVIAALQPPETTTESGKETVALPFQLKGTQLIAEHMVSYEGPYIEDGSDVPVFNIAALMIYNTGQQEIEQVSITLYLREQTLTFSGQNILPGMHVMLLEQSKQSYTQAEIVNYSCTYTEQNEDEAIAVYIAERGMGELVIKNCTDEALSDVVLYHKLWQPADIYVGGITYITHVGSLQPGQTLSVMPEHYAAGYSKIIKATK